MSTSLGSRIRGGCFGIGSLGAVIGGVATIDQTCRQYLVDALHGQLPVSWVGPSVQQITHEIADLLPLGNTTVLAFGATAVVLFLLMFKS